MTSPVLSLNALERAHAVCDDFRPTAQSALPHDSLAMGEGTLSERRVYVFAQDARVEGGSFGVAESDAVVAWLHQARQNPAPLILFLDSGGARMSEGLAALGGFRRLFRALSQVWLTNAPIIAVCGKTVFGGASMLACVADARVFFDRSLLGMSGPRIVQAVAGVADFDAANKAMLGETMGGAARVARGQGVRADDDVGALRGAITNALDKVSAESNTLKRLTAYLIAQRQSLEREGLARTGNAEKIPNELIRALSVRNAWVDEGVLIGRSTDDAFLYGIVNQKWADSWDAWKLSNALLCQMEIAPSAPVHIVLDCPAHATSRALEADMISQYFSLLGLTIRAMHAAGSMVTLHITGDAAGGVHVALAGGASRVIAYEGANIRILPRIAIDQVRAEVADIEPTAAQWLETGVVDALV